MKLKRLYIPCSELFIGDILLLDATHVRKFPEKGEVRCVLLSKDFIDFDSYLLTLCSREGIYDSVRIPRTACLEILSWKQHATIPVFARDLELNDTISPIGGGIADHISSATIIQIQDHYKNNVRDFTVSCSFLTSTEYDYFRRSELFDLCTIAIRSESQILKFSAQFNDLIQVPLSGISDDQRNFLTERYAPFIEENDFQMHLEMVLKQSVLKSHQQQCSFVLGERCTTSTHVTYNEKYICDTCVKKIAALAIYGTSFSLRAYNEKNKQRSL